MHKGGGMGFIKWAKEALLSMLLQDAKQIYSVDPITTPRMDTAQGEWMRTYAGKPRWLTNEIKTVNFAKTVCETTANLATLDIKINFSGGPRAKWLQAETNRALFAGYRLRKWVEYGAAAGTVIFKPNGAGLDIITPGNFVITECDSNRRITGAVFRDTYQRGDYFYTRLEYHRTEGGTYRISTRAFVSRSAATLGAEISLEDTKWAGIEPEVYIGGVEDGRALFGVFSMPAANGLDLDSPLGVSIFSNALQELEDLDIAYSRNAWEIKQSNTIELIDDRLLQSADGSITLPSHVHKVFGGNNTNGGEFYQAIERPLRTADRITGINHLLSLIGSKCGYSDGYFVLDGRTGLVTATQVESDDRKTIQLIKDIRDALQAALDDTFYALTIMADLYDLSPGGSYKVDYAFGDITYSYDEDRARWYQMAQSGMVPKWMYLTKFEGMSEDEARRIVSETETAAAGGLFPAAE